MARKRKHGVDLPEHVHRVVSKGKIYFFHQAHRGTARQGLRLALPRDPKSVEFWDALRAIAGKVPGYSGTVAAMIDAYLSSPEFKALANNSQRICTRYLGHIKLVIGRDAPDAIRPSHVIALRDQYADRPGAANQVVSSLSTVYKWARPRDYALNNPCTRLGKFKLGEHKPWPQEMIDLVLTARWEIRRFVLLTLHTAQREGDVCAMSLHDVDDDMIRVVQEKTKKELWIPMHKDLVSIVDECRAAGTINLLPRGNGHSFSANQFRALWGRELKKEKFKPIREAGLVPHGLCKNAHNRLFDAGNNAKEVQSVTGRSDAMVAHYSKGHDQKKSARRAVARAESMDAENVLQTSAIPKQNQA